MRVCSLLVFLFACNNTDSDDETQNVPDDTSVETDTGALSCTPSAEVCDGLDNDCDGEIDEDATDRVGVYLDDDGDGYGDPDEVMMTCLDAGEAPEGYAAIAGDCDDTDAAVSPAADEVCNLIDDNCSGSIDDDPIDGVTYYPDTDGDGYGSPGSFVLLCEPAEGYQTDATDCDDTDPEVSPEAEEVCFDDVDNNCDGTQEMCQILAEELATVRWYGQRANEGDLRVRAADINGDGVEDAVVGQPASSNTDGTINDGAAFVYYGPLSGSYDLDEASADAHIVATDASNDRLAERIQVLDDFTGDGGSELVLAATQYGTSEGGLLVYTSDTLADSTATLGVDDADILLVGESRRGYLGASVHPADQDGDGLTDLLIGASNAPDSQTRQGRVYLVYGGLTAGSYAIDEAAAGYVTGSDIDDRIGQAGTASMSGDLDGDGINEVLIGAPLYEEERGGVFVFYGAISGAWDAEDADALLQDGYLDTRLGRSVVTAGDVDGDGLDDLYIGAPRGDGDESNIGRVYFLHGSATLSGEVDVEDSAVAQVVGTRGNDQIGAVMETGDATGDGIQDLMIGATGAGALSEGRAYLIAGPLSGTIRTDDDALFRVAGAVDSDKLGDRVDISPMGSAYVSAAGADAVADNAGAVYGFSAELLSFE